MVRSLIKTLATMASGAHSIQSNSLKLTLEATKLQTREGSLLRGREQTSDSALRSVTGKTSIVDQILATWGKTFYSEWTRIMLDHLLTTCKGRMAPDPPNHNQTADHDTLSIDHLVISVVMASSSCQTFFTWQIQGHQSQRVATSCRMKFSTSTRSKASSWLLPNTSAKCKKWNSTSESTEISSTT